MSNHLNTSFNFEEDQKYDDNLWIVIMIIISKNFLVCGLFLLPDNVFKELNLKRNMNNLNNSFFTIKYLNLIFFSYVYKYRKKIDFYINEIVETNNLESDIFL